jgi:hypothetical protein
MKWGTILPGIQALLVKLTGLAAVNVGELDVGDQKFTSSKKKGQISFSIISVKSIGNDELRYAFDPDADENESMSVTVCGNREFTLGIRFEGFDHGFERAAAWYLERIFTRLSRPASAAALRAVECSWVGASPFVNLNATISDEDRIFSRGQRDFSFITVVNDADDDPADIGGFIETVELYSDTLDITPGTPAGLQIDTLITIAP